MEDCGEEKLNTNGNCDEIKRVSPDVGPRVSDTDMVRDGDHGPLAPCSRLILSAHPTIDTKPPKSRYERYPELRSGTMFDLELVRFAVAS